MAIFSTKRLSLREFTLDDAAFLLGVMNQPNYHRYIGDRGLRSLEDAQTYIEATMMPAYKKYGYGFWVMEHQDAAVGFAGMVKRDELPFPDVGYALSDSVAGRGLVTEAVHGVLAYNRDTLGQPTLQAITDAENHASIRVLLKCGFSFIGQQQVFDQEWLNVYQVDALKV